MLKLFLLALLALVAAVSAGYNYQSSESHTTHQVQPAPQPSSHSDGYEKQFYYFNAPQEHVEHSQPLKKITPQQVKKNLQVIFIKPPVEKHHHQATPNVVQQSTTVEEKTHIYVLQPERRHAASAPKVQHVQQATVHHHKPEVHFVKYRTPAEAQRVQQTIIEQYGGKPSEVVHGGSAAPVVNFLNSHHNSAPHHESSASVNRQYLAPPPVAYRF